MAYVPPAFNAVDFDDGGASYVPPNFNAVDFDEGTGGAIAATESSDVASIVAANWTVASIAAVESGDSAAVAAEVTAGASIAAVESSESSAIVAFQVLEASIAAGESSDGAAITALPALLAVIDAGEAPDSAAVTVLNALLATVAATEESDAASIGTATVVGGSIGAVESTDHARLVEAGSVAVSGFDFIPRRWRIMLYEPLPLRTSAQLGNFAEEFVLAHRYGDLTSGRFALQRLDDSTFFVADHPMPVTAVFIDDQTTKSWDRKISSDGVGNVWTVVRLAAPAPNGARVSACGTGKRNPRTGALIDNPADIIEDVLRIAGRDDRWWDQLRAEAAAEGLRLAGSLDSALTIGAVIDAICASCGAIWAPGMARLYPTANVAGYIAQLDKQKVSNIEVTANLDNTCDILRVYYDPDAAAEKSQHFIELSANPLRYGGISQQLSMPWLRTPGNAESVGRRMLQWFAGERYDVSYDCGDKRIRCGVWNTLTSHPEWPIPGADPTVMVLGATVTPGSNTVQCSGSALLSVPIVTVTGHTLALPATRDAAVEVEIKDGILTFIVTDRDSKPVPGVLVGLDGGQPQTTDAQGIARFPQPKKGEHKLAIQAPGKLAETLTLTV
jgi:hypothetical protein